MKTAIVCTAVLLLMTALSMAQGNGSAVYLDNVEGLVNGNIQVGSGSVTFNIYCMNGDSFNEVKGVSNGFRIYGSDSSVTWEDLYYTLPPDIIFYLAQYSLFVPPQFNGVGADTIGFTAASFMTPGIPPGYVGDFFWITVALTDTASVGGTFCLDSSWFPPDGIWIWAYDPPPEGPGSFAPSWSGPHCWPIIGECCLGQRGNVDFDPEDQLDISDLVFMVDYMFTGGPVPPCWEEADIDGSGGDGIDITDLVHLVDYMFTGGPPPADCP
jgi:hypothetical protein